MEKFNGDRIFGDRRLTASNTRAVGYKEISPDILVLKGNTFFPVWSDQDITLSNNIQDIKYNKELLKRSLIDCYRSYLSTVIPQDNPPPERKIMPEDIKRITDAGGDSTLFKLVAKNWGAWKDFFRRWTNPF